MSISIAALRHRYPRLDSTAPQLTQVEGVQLCSASHPNHPPTRHRLDSHLSQPAAVHPQLDTCASDWLSAGASVSSLHARPRAPSAGVFFAQPGETWETEGQPGWLTRSSMYTSLSYSDVCNLNRPPALPVPSSPTPRASQLSAAQAGRQAWKASHRSSQAD